MILMISATYLSLDSVIHTRIEKCSTTIRKKAIDSTRVIISIKPCDCMNSPNLRHKNISTSLESFTPNIIVGESSQKAGGKLGVHRPLDIP